MSEKMEFRLVKSPLKPHCFTVFLVTPKIILKIHLHNCTHQKKFWWTISAKNVKNTLTEYQNFCFFKDRYFEKWTLPPFIYILSNKVNNIISRYVKFTMVVNNT